MTKTIKEFFEGDVVESFFGLKEASYATAKNGKPYLRATLSDSSGTISANKWDIDQKFFATLTVGGAVKVVATVESYRDVLQLRIEKIRTAKNSEIDYSRLLPASSADLQLIREEIFAAIAQITDSDYQNLLHEFFNDENFCTEFFRAPAAKSNHHAWIGGLCEHTAAMLRYGKAMLAANPESARLNADLLLTGILLHDVGKIHELSLGATLEYSDVGKLLGHISLGVLMIERRAPENFPALKKQLLQHLLLSHHGELEYGSPVLPQIPEAFILHHLDNLDAKTTASINWIRDDVGGGDWTAKSFMLGVSLFKAPRQISSPDEDEKETASAKHKAIPVGDEKASKKSGKNEKADSLFGN